VDAGLLAADEVGLGLGVFWPYGVGSLIAVARGQHVAAEAWLARARHLSGSRALGAEWLGFAAAALAEADGDAEGAAARYERIATRIVQARVPTLLLNTGADAVRLALATGRTATAARVADALGALATRTTSPVAGALAAWSSGLVGGDHRPIQAAAERLSDAKRLPDATRALHDAAVVAARSHDDAQARRLAKAAFAGYDQLGAQQWHSRLRSELRATGLTLRPRRTPARPADGWESLTPSETTVVQLVAEGLTNTQIGERLYVSRRTVESHLGRVYTKLDLVTRAQLVAAATRHPFA
jgi:DNA-binding CsgD family transcriptional regulator